MSSFEIVGWDPRHAGAFGDLNLRWLREYFVVEPIDEAVLGDPQTHILDGGGAIWFAVQEDHAVGTVAVKVHADGRDELTKLAVDPDVQGAGMGDALCRAVIEWHRDRRGAGQANLLFLETNTVLAPALRLYERLAFHRVEPPEASPYERSNCYMVWRPEFESLRGSS